MSPFDLIRAQQLMEPQRRATRASSPCGACAVRHLTVCAPLEDRELAEVASISTTLEIDPGEPLFDEGEPADKVFNITAGCVKVYKLLADGRRQVTGFLFAGDFLGLSNDAHYAYSAEAVTHACLCRFNRRKLEALLERHPKMEKRLLSMASNELAAAQEQMLLLGRKTAKEKIASFLLMLSRRAQQRGQAGNPVSVPMSRTDIGDYLGLTTETVSRTFTHLKTAGTIRMLSGGRIELVEIEPIRDLAEGG
ncbi:MAG: helix-turn-helix domain-containing protein [Rhodovibrionaceae bacterium]|nr:helix-turn-helix domain-containing protein [Rhodovibrionaceae bacterium]